MTDDRDPRRRRPPVAGLLALLALVLVASVVVGLVVARHHSDSPSARTPPPPPPVTTATPPSSPSPSSSPPATARTLPVGITFGNRLFGVSRAKVDQALDDVVRLHLTWIRVDMNWASLQPSSAVRVRWGPLDDIVASARRHRLKVLGLLSYTPSWARSPGCSTFTCPPRSAPQFARFAASVARRYRDDGVTSFQIWNEPNINLFWTSPDPLRYRALLAATVPALRATGRGLRILFGGLAVASDEGADLSATTFLRRACAGRTCPVDAVGYDPYTYPALPGSTSRPYNAVQQLINPSAGSSGFRAALAATGLSAAKVWLTGFGAPSGQDASTDPRVVSEARQSAIVLDGLRLARASDVVGGYFVDTLRDTTGGSPKDRFGLERADGTAKPAFSALARALAR